MFKITLMAAFIVLMPVAALAQSDPLSVGPMGTPITPEFVGAWSSGGGPGITRAEAWQAAREDGFGPILNLSQDRYGDWMGQGARGSFVVLPNGEAFPL